MSQITITSSNFNGYIGDITFYPYSGGSISYGSQTIPYTIETENFNGEYNIQLDYEGVEVNCGVQVGASPCVNITATDAFLDFSGLYEYIGEGYLTYDSRTGEWSIVCDDTSPKSYALYLYFSSTYGSLVIGNVDDIVGRTEELRITQFSLLDLRPAPCLASFVPPYGWSIAAIPQYSSYGFPLEGNYSSGVPNQGTYFLENNPSCQLVPDVDANAYLEDVIASGGTTNPTINNAVNTLFEELKSAGLYSKMKAMYPYIGATASSHAINALLDKTFDITWNGGLTHDISGTTGNGSNGYGNTHITNDVVFSADSKNLSFGYYQNSLFTPIKSESPIGGISSNYNWVQVYNEPTNSNWRVGAFLSPGVYTHGGDTSGNYIGSRTGTTSEVVYRNGTQIITKSGDDGIATPNTAEWYILNFNNGGPFSGYYSKQRFSFHFACEGLSNSEITTLDGIINTFQTSLGRNTY